MKRYLLAYAAWLACVLAGTYVALVWYRRVEGIGWREMAQRTGTSVLADPSSNTSDTSNEG